jgi:hypothetical protein
VKSSKPGCGSYGETPSVRGGSPRMTQITIVLQNGSQILKTISGMLQFAADT